MTESFIELLERNENHAQRFENERFEPVQDGQTPAFVTVCCSDSRVLQDELVENREPGRIFTCSNIGNRVMQKTAAGTSVSGDVLYPIEHTDTENAIVIGHTGCGAVTAAYKDLTGGIEEPAGIRHCVDIVKDRLADGIEKLPDGIEESKAINRLVEYNVDQQIDFLLDSDVVPETVDVLGVVYDFQDVYSDERGTLHVINVNGTRKRTSVEKEQPELAERMSRLWRY